MADNFKTLKKHELKQLIKSFKAHEKMNVTGKTKPQLLELANSLITDNTIKLKPKVKRALKNNEYNGSGFLDIFKGVQADYSNSSKRVLKMPICNEPITSIQVVRTPIQSAIAKILNVLSLKKYSFDDLFHLALICKVGNKNIVVEKNEKINVSFKYKSTSETEYLDVPLNKKLTINELLQATLSKFGKQKYFLYNSLTNNCQDFIIMVLNANELNNPQLTKFIKQNLDELKKKIPSFLPKVMNAVTDLGAKATEVFGGAKSQYKQQEDDYWAKNEEIRKGLKAVNQQQVEDTRKGKKEEQRQREEAGHQIKLQYYQYLWTFLKNSGMPYEIEQGDTLDDIDAKCKKFIKEQEDKKIFLRSKGGTYPFYQYVWQSTRKENVLKRINEVVPMNKIIDFASEFGSLVTGKEIPKLSGLVETVYNNTFDKNNERKEEQPQPQEEQPQEGAGRKKRKYTKKKKTSKTVKPKRKYTKRKTGGNSVASKVDIKKYLY